MVIQSSNFTIWWRPGHLKEKQFIEISPLLRSAASAAGERQRLSHLRNASNARAPGSYPIMHRTF